MHRYCSSIIAVLAISLIGHAYIVNVNATVNGIFDADQSMVVAYNLNYSKEHAQLDVFWISNSSEMLKTQSFVLPEEMDGNELEPSGVEPIPLYFYGTPGILFIAEKESETYGEDYVTFPMINVSSDLYEYLSRFWMTGGDYFVAQSVNGVPIVGNKSAFCVVSSNLSLGTCYPNSFGLPWPMYVDSSKIIVSDIGSGDVYKFSENGWKKIYSSPSGGFFSADVVDNEIHYLTIPPKDMRNRVNCSYVVFSTEGTVKFIKEFSCGFLPDEISYTLHVENNVSYVVAGKYLYASLDKVHWIVLKKFERPAIPVGDYLVFLEVRNGSSRISVEPYPPVGLVSDLEIKVTGMMPSSFPGQAKNVTVVVWAEAYNHGLLDCDSVNVTVYIDTEPVACKEFPLNAFSKKDISFVILNSERFGVGNHTVGLLITGSCNETYLENNRDEVVLKILPACTEGELKGSLICHNGIFVPCTCDIPECTKILNCSKPEEYKKPIVKTKEVNVLPYILGLVLAALVLIFLVFKYRKRREEI